MRALIYAILLTLLTVSAFGQCPPPSPTNWCSGTYQYDGMGNIKTIGADTYVYDEMGRLKNGTADVQRTGRMSRQNYDYDLYGNRTNVYRDGGSVDCLGGCELSPPLAVNASTNHITNHTCDDVLRPCYDAAGNLIRIDSASYSYDAAGMLVRAISTDDRQYVYTADDERIATKNGLSWTWTVRGIDQKVLREFTSAEVNGLPTSNRIWAKDYVWRDGKLLASVAPGSNGNVVQHYHLDHLGTPRVVSNAGTGMRVGEHAYYPFGAELSLTPQELPAELMKYTGHERDVQGNDPHTLDMMHARYEMATLGRFLSPDPQHGNPVAPQSWNRYTYVLNSPLGYTDKNGREIYEQVHKVFRPWYHTSTRIEPVDQARWANTEHFRNNINPVTGRHYATIGAGDEHGLLTAGINRPRDRDLNNKKETQPVDLKGRSENEVIETLFALEANYRNNLTYAAFPDGVSSFNSNSFNAGLLLAAGLDAPTPHETSPGFDKPVDERQFGLFTVPDAVRPQNQFQRLLGDRVVMWLWGQPPPLPAGTCVDGQADCR